MNSSQLLAAGLGAQPSTQRGPCIRGCSWTSHDPWWGGNEKYTGPKPTACIEIWKDQTIFPLNNIFDKGLSDISLFFPSSPHSINASLSLSQLLLSHSLSCLFLLIWETGLDRYFKIYPYVRSTFQRVSISEIHQSLFLKGLMLIPGSQLLHPHGEGNYLKTSFEGETCMNMERSLVWPQWLHLFQKGWPSKGPLRDFLGCLFPPATEDSPPLILFMWLHPYQVDIKENLLIQAVSKCQNSK